MNAINRSATRSKTLHCGINRGINLGNIKSGISSIQFKIGFHHRDSTPSLSTSIVVQMLLGHWDYQPSWRPHPAFR